MFMWKKCLLIIATSFQRKGVFGNFTTIEEFCCFLYPLENDLMSMEINDCFKVNNFVIFIICFIILKEFY